jgi:hypothetical protein
MTGLLPFRLAQQSHDSVSRSETTRLSPIGAVEQGATDAPDVSLNLRGRASAFSGRVIPEATGTSTRCPFAMPL